MQALKNLNLTHWQAIWSINWGVIPSKYRQSIFIALGVSLLIHLLLLGVSPTTENPPAKHLKAPLSVVLVNSQSALAPLNPRRLAQLDLNGGGLANEPVTATALEAVSPVTAQQLKQLQQEQTKLLALHKEGLATSSQTALRKKQEEQEVTDPLEAELSKRLLRESQIPRKAIWTSTSAKSVVYAQYYDAMKRKVEQYGTQFFPRSAAGPLYGSLVLLVSVNQQGKILHKPTIERSSGVAELDRQAIAIVNAAAPFGRFPEAMQSKLDVIDWIATFDFIQGQNISQLELRMHKTTKP